MGIRRMLRALILLPLWPLRVSLTIFFAFTKRLLVQVVQRLDILEDVAFPERARMTPQSTTPFRPPNTKLSTLESLPDELLHLIFSHLSIKDCCRACSVSHEFRRLLSSQIFGSFKYVNNQKTLAFLLSLLKNSNLGSLVKHANFEDRTVLIDWRYDRLSKPKEWQTTSEQMLTIGRHWLWSGLSSSIVGRDLIDCNDMAISGHLLALILSQTPDVHSIVAPKRPNMNDIQDSQYPVPSMHARTGNAPIWRELHPCLEPVVFAAKGLSNNWVPFTYSCLSRIKIHMDCTWGECASCLFNLPVLKKLTIVGLDDYSLHQTNEEPPDWECAAGTSSVTDLQFVEAVADLSTIERAVASCKSLRKFHYHQGYHYHHARSGLYHAVTKSLRKHRETLKLLGISETRTEDLSDDKLGPLDDFTSLEILIAPLALLWGLGSLAYSQLSICDPRTRILPANLKSLGLIIQPHTHPDQDAQSLLESSLSDIASTQLETVRAYITGTKPYDPKLARFRPMDWKKNLKVKGCDFTYRVFLGYNYVKKEEAVKIAEHYKTEWKDPDFEHRAEVPYKGADELDPWSTIADISTTSD